MIPAYSQRLQDHSHIKWGRWNKHCARSRSSYSSAITFAHIASPNRTEGPEDRTVTATFQFLAYSRWKVMALYFFLRKTSITMRATLFGSVQRKLRFFIVSLKSNATTWTWPVCIDKMRPRRCCAYHMVYGNTASLEKVLRRQLVADSSQFNRSWRWFSLEVFCSIVGRPFF